MKKKKTPLVVLFSLLVLLLLLLVPSVLEPGFVLAQKWASDIDSYGFADESNLTSFRLGNIFGYIDDNGEIYYRDTVIHDVVFGNNEFINYGSEDDVLYLSTAGGAIINTLETSDYPFYKRGRLFTVGYDRQSLFSHDGSFGELYFSAVISDVDASSKHVVVGLLDDGLKAYDNSGELVLAYTHDDSRISAVYSVAISEDSQYLAAVVGVEKQFLLVFKNIDGRFERFIADVMPYEYRRNVVLDFVGPGTLIVENPEGIDLLDLDKGSARSFKLPGRYIDSGFIEDKYFGVYTAAGGKCVIDIFAESGEILLSSDLAVDSTVIFRGDSFIVGENNKLSAFTVKKLHGGLADD